MSLVVRLKCVTASEFWTLTPNEAALMIDDAIESQNKHDAEKGGLTDEARERLDKRRARLAAKGVNVQ